MSASRSDAAKRDDGSGREAANLNTVVELARRLVGGHRASLMLPADDARELRIAAASGLPAKVTAETRVRFGDSISGVVAQTRQPMQVNEPGAATSRAARYRTGSFISVPVPLNDATCGVLNVADPVAGGAFGSDDLITLQSFAEYIAHHLAPMPAQQRVRQLQDAIRQTQWQLIQAQENERQRIARDLHDEASHALTAAIFRLDLEALALPDEAASTRAALGRIRESLMECAATLHSIAFALRPRILEDLGLGAALRSLAQQAMEAGSLQVTLTIDGDERPLGEPIELAVFRVVQEALTNIRKHAAASRVWVRLAFQPRRLAIVVEDDGVGIVARQATRSARPGLGLGGMRERVEVLGGTFEAGPRDGGGTRLHVLVPLAAEGDDRDRA